MKKVFVFLFSALLCAALLLSSCGGKPTVSVSPTASPTAPTTSSPSEETGTTPATGTPDVTGTPTETPVVTETPTESPVTPVTPTPPQTTTPILPPGEDYTPFFPEEKVIAFTFDDGPDWWTSYILDTLEGTDDKVTFFITGYMIDNSYKDGMDYGKTVKRAYEMGCDVGLHGYDHRNIYYASRDEDAPPEIYNHEIYDLAAKYKDILGTDPKYFRPVGGSFRLNKDYGYPIILWTVDSKDWAAWDKYALDKNGNIDYENGLYSNDPAVKAAVTEKAVQEIVDTVLSQVRSGDIVLMHDIYDITRQAFARLYPILKERGYKLVNVTELLGITPEMHAGDYFYSTYFWGRLGVEQKLDLPASVFALPPEKND